MTNNFDEFELNLLEIEDYKKKTNSRLRFWFDHIRKNAHKKDGDIFEFGVYRGSSLIAAALILKELGSTKKVYGFDTFEGFPNYSKFDDLINFYRYPKIFNKKFIKQFERFKKVKKIITNTDSLNKISIASSGNFSQTSYKLLIKKINYLKLNNIRLIKGPFSKTVKNFFKINKKKISSANLDCDLYESYKICLPLIYENLVKSGYVNLDEYFSFKYPGARLACDEFFADKNIIPIKNKSRLNEFERWCFRK